jgi:hypothetical protein
VDPVIAHRITKAKLLRLVSRDIAALCAGITLPEPYTAAIFKKQPVRIGMVEKALRKLGPDYERPLLLVGLDFTVEALACAESHGVHVVAHRHFGWTEESFDKIHRLVSSGRPVDE